MRDIVSTQVRFVAKKANTVGNVVSPSLFPRVKNENTTWLSTNGFYKCGHSKCKACGFATVSKTFTSTSISNPHPLKTNGYLNCNTKWCIYLITCQECLLQYVGCTSNPLKVRIRRHLSNVSNVNALGISA